MGSISLRAMESARLVLLAAVAVCALVNSSTDVEEFYDNLGPSELSREIPQAILLVDEGKEKAGNTKGKGANKVSWSCAMAKQCKCAGEMARRGVETRDMMLLGEEAFSREDQLAFLQLQESPDIFEEASKFAGYKRRQQESSEDEDDGNAGIQDRSEYVKMAKEFTKVRKTPLTNSASNKAVVTYSGLKWHDFGQRKKTTVSKTPVQSTRGIEKVLKEADEQDAAAQEKNAIEGMNDKKLKCIKFCTQLADQARKRAEALAGEMKKAELEQQEKQIEKKEKIDK